MEELIKQYCKTLKIGKSFYEGYRDIQAESHEEFLLELLRREAKKREIARKNRLLKAAGFDVIKTFNGYAFDNIQIPSSIDLSELKGAGFINKKENLILYGPVGTGKTHLATAIGVEACQQGKRVKFFRTAALVNRLTDAKAEGELKKFFKQLTKCDLLICDELGYIPLKKKAPSCCSR